MAGRLARANSVIDLENESPVVVSGTPAAVTERVSAWADPSVISSH